MGDLNFFNLTPKSPLHRIEARGFSGFLRGGEGTFTAVVGRLLPLSATERGPGGEVENGNERKLSISYITVFLLLFALSITILADTHITQITIINTSDEHGWIQPFTAFGSSEVQGGAANIYAWWQNEGVPDYDLLLSGGDNWTGPSISTWFEGQPIVEAFNLMGYDASAIGNHEFDFGRDVMEERFAEAEYPYLAANIRYKDSGELVDFAQPYTILDAQGVQVGVIGLTTVDTVTSTHPKNISDLEFAGYVETLEKFVPQMRDEGAEVIVALTHVCAWELTLLAPKVNDLVDAMFAGHCNESVAREVDGVSVMGGGAHWRSYARLTMSFDKDAGEVVAFDQAIVDVVYDSGEGNPVEADGPLSELTERWQAEVDVALGLEIGQVTTTIPQRSDIMGNWVTDAWLWAFPNVDIAITNRGGLRQDIQAGPITVNDVVGMLPFENSLVVVEITAEQLAENLYCCGGLVSGMTYQRDVNGVTMRLADGSSFDREATYRVIINDFMYAGGDGFLFSDQDPDAYFTGVQWRQPVIDYTASLDGPLDDYLDFETRGQ